MNYNFSPIIIFIWILGLIACSSHTIDPASVRAITADNSSTVIARTDGFIKDSVIAQKDALTKIYSLAIADYIKAVNQEYKIKFDTLFFGKHIYGQPDDFPDITLPAIIENIPIRLITPEVGLIKQKERRSLVYINLIGFVSPEKAEFIFVNFSNFGEHQYDCFMDYKFNTQLKAFGLESLRFKNYDYKQE